MPKSTYLYRPVNQQALDLIAGSGGQAFPPRLPEQPIFCLVLNEECAAQISRDWNVPYYGVGFIVRCSVETAYLAQFPVRHVGDAQHNELWVPAAALEEFNRYIVGAIRLVATGSSRECCA